MIKALALVMFMSSSAYAGILDITGLADLAAQKAKESRALTILDYSGKFSGGAYLPIWQLKDTAGVKYLAFGAGGEARQGESPRPLLTFTANLPALSGRLWSSQWAKTHIERTHFPPLFLGPALRLPMPSERAQWRDWRDYLGVMVSIGVGGE